ncbi:uncharacterized protein LOC134769325 isoform X3 [Penaeus indicus]|uniref:uncharacterized protein LOC134769325 isoform X3 n=1 Tax=Penaeus indicus TaxID=29960 RepID=UPI00300C00DB
MTALHWACDRGHTSVVGLLLKHHAKTDVVNKFAKPPLHIAVERGHQQIIRLLQEGVNYKEEEEAVAVESISLNVTDDLNSIPVVCKTEEVCTEEYEEEPVEDQVEKEEEERFSMEGDLPHSILADDSDEVASAAALELLKAQAALLPVDDSSTLVTSAVAHGQTLHLTEAGRQALKLIKQEMPLLPTATLKQDHLNADHNKCAKSSTSSNSSSHRNRNKHTESSYSSSTLTAPCLPALLSTSGVESIVEEIADESQEVTQVITLSPEQYAALTGETNGPIILQVLSSGEDQLNELDTGQIPPAPKRQKVMQLVTKTGQGLASQNQAVAKVSGQVLSVDVSRGGNL